MKTWHLETLDGQKTVLEDGKGNYRLEPEGDFQYVAEFREDEHPKDNKEAWRDSVAAKLNVQLELVEGEDLSTEEVYG